MQQCKAECKLRLEATYLSQHWPMKCLCSPADPQCGQPTSCEATCQHELRCESRPEQRGLQRDLLILRDARKPQTSIHHKSNLQQFTRSNKTVITVKRTRSLSGVCVSTAWYSRLVSRPHMDCTMCDVCRRSATTCDSKSAAFALEHFHDATNNLALIRRRGSSRRGSCSFCFRASRAA